MMMTEYERPALPRIVRFLETDDAPGSSCPHCGATGRFIHRFVVEDGRTLGAMRGCVKLFPVSPVAREALRLDLKARRYKREGWPMSAADQRALDAISALESGTGNEASVLSVIKLAKASNSARYRGRR